MTQSGEGVFYVATGPKSVLETVASILSLLRSNPRLPVSVFTDDPATFGKMRSSLDQITVIENPSHSFGDKILGFLAAPYARNLFLDADTYVAGDISDMFALLSRFDLAACHAPGFSGARTHPYESDQLPAAFPQFNTGVVCFRATAEVNAAFRRWRDIFEPDPEHPYDQPSFRQAMFESELSLYVLPPEYNFLAGHAYLCGPVKVFHYHFGKRDPEPFAHMINATSGPRVFVPPDKLFPRLPAPLK